MSIKSGVNKTLSQAAGSKIFESGRSVFDLEMKNPSPLLSSPLLSSPLLSSPLYSIIVYFLDSYISFGASITLRAPIRLLNILNRQYA